MRNRLLSFCLLKFDVGVYAEESVNERLVPSNSLATAFSHFGDNLYFFHFRGFTLVIACWSRQSTSFGKENKLSCLWCLWLCYFGTRQIMTRHRRCFLPLAQSKQNLWLIETDNAGGRGGARIICFYCSPAQVTIQNNNATGGEKNRNFVIMCCLVLWLSYVAPIICCLSAAADDQKHKASATEA